MGRVFFLPTWDPGVKNLGSQESYEIPTKKGGHVAVIQ